VKFDKYSPAVHRCDILLPVSRGLSVCLLVTTYHVQCSNGWTDRDAVCDVDSGGPRNRVSVGAVGGSRSPQGKRQCWENLPLPVVKYLFFSRPRFEGWLVHPRVGQTMDVLSPLISVLCHSDWLFHGQSCQSRPCVAFLACVHLALLLALSLSQGNSLVSAWCDHSMLASLLCRRTIVWTRVSRSYVVFRC